MQITSRVPGAQLVLALALLASGSLVQAREPSLAEVKAASAKFQDVKAAIAEGYTTDGKCMTAAMIGYPPLAGAMGLHYVRKDLIGIQHTAPGHRVSGTGTHTDFLKPSMLVYEPQADGSLKLVAVENLVFEAAWRAGGHDTPPRFHRAAYVLLKDDPSTTVDEAHNYEPHYELHAWLFRRNPRGLFVEFNPNVTCSQSGAFKPM
jgi:hypothetical protein